MGQRQKRWADEAYYKLITGLGGKCVTCGTDGTQRKNPLTVDHIRPRDWEPKEVERSHRISIYRREAREGKLQVLCSRCNKRKGKPQNL